MFTVKIEPAQIMFPLPNETLVECKTEGSIKLGKLNDFYFSGVSFINWLLTLDDPIAQTAFKVEEIVFR